MVLNIKVCTDGREWRLKIVGQILEAKMLNGSSFHNQPDSPVMVLGQLLLAPFLDTEMENKLGIMPVFFTKKGLSYQVLNKLLNIKYILFSPSFTISYFKSILLVLMHKIRTSLYPFLYPIFLASNTVTQNGIILI